MHQFIFRKVGICNYPFAGFPNNGHDNFIFQFEGERVSAGHGKDRGIVQNNALIKMKNRVDVA